ncbi:hypothetical protein BW723_11125 [Polaribacter reichenbachii]|uniref:2TM domain-containing protein n=1 Tax=Polaribacter reichenbachii TaxID=996801 RepID=A0A1B8TPX6_9FLAO|nr:hypothetical protein [Polaribacter reichenbachii]APZ46802.1 hypothetical protein BW723_11125 [Polaribacter reichenbachii]AUC17445.1 hypothetical protein BTO17_01570 [Polaribacter reichenbachii]OBY61681.1 hypothetical protein LPB301_16640 [Polaribacter reichenbachii]
MEPNNFIDKRNQKFLKYWEEKRKNKKEYTIKNSAVFSFIFSALYCVIKYGFSTESLKVFPICFLMISVVYGLYVYFIEFNLHEKKYQKLKKEL